MKRSAIQDAAAKNPGLHPGYTGDKYPTNLVLCPGDFAGRHSEERSDEESRQLRALRQAACRATLEPCRCGQRSHGERGIMTHREILALCLAGVVALILHVRGW
jgi:hypothetical protein